MAAEKRRKNLYFGKNEIGERITFLTTDQLKKNPDPTL